MTLDFLQDLGKINLNQNLLVEGIVMRQLLKYYCTKELKKKNQRGVQTDTRNRKQGRNRVQ